MMIYAFELTPAEPAAELMPMPFLELSPLRFQPDAIFSFIFTLLFAPRAHYAIPDAATPR